MENNDLLWRWRAQGDANFYLITQGKRWIAGVQLNGELTLEAQAVQMNLLCAAYNMSLSTESEADNG